MPTSAEKSDQQLITDYAKNGGNASFAILVKRHSPLVYSVAQKIVLNHHDAEDITQATFVALAKNASKATFKTTAASWLATISNRLALNLIKSRQSRTAREHKTMPDKYHLDQNPNQQSTLQPELFQALDKLPDRYRRPLQLLYLEEKSADEISSSLSINPSTLRTRISRAKQLLKKSLTKKGFEFASITALLTTLASRSNAQTIPQSLTQQLLQNLSNNHTKLSIQVQEIANTLNTPHLLFTKQKITTGAGVLLTATALGVIFTRDTTNLQNIEKAPSISLQSPLSSQNRDRQSTNNLKKTISRGLINQVMLISDQNERWLAVQDVLGLKISKSSFLQSLQTGGFISEIPELSFYRVVHHAALENPEATSQWLLSLPEQSLLPQITDQLSDILPPQTIHSIEKSIVKKYQTQNMHELLVLGSQAYQRLPEDQKLPRKSPQSLQKEISLILKEGNLVSQQRSLMRSIEQLATSDLESAKKLTLAIHTASISKAIPCNIATSLTRAWSYSDPDSALAWALNLDDEKMMKDAILGLIPSWCSKYPNQEFDLSPTPQAHRDEIMGLIIEIKSLKDPKAATLLATSQNIEGQPKKISRAAQAASWWTKQDPEEAIEWLGNHPNEALKQRVIYEICSSKTLFDLPKVTDIALNLSDNEARRRTLITLVQDSLVTDFNQVTTIASKHLSFMETNEVTNMVSLILQSSEDPTNIINYFDLLQSLAQQLANQNKLRTVVENSSERILLSPEKAQEFVRKMDIFKTNRMEQLKRQLPDQ